MTPIRVCIAGVSGWAGSALARHLVQTDDIDVVAGVSRGYARQTIGQALGIVGHISPIFATAAEALSVPFDVFVEYTNPDVAKLNVLAALQKGVHVVIGTSGLDDDDYAEINQAACAANRGVLAVGNFALTAVLLQKFAEIAAKYIAHWEIIDYASSIKQDAPSGTAREMAARLAMVHESQLDVPLDEIKGPVESRGVRLKGSQVHSVRLPGYEISVEAIFGMPNEKLVLRHEAGNSADPYTNGALIAIRNVSRLVGLHRGLASVMDFEGI